MEMSFLFVAMFALGGGLGGDLLDFTPTAGYWLAQDQRVVDVQTMSAVLEDADATATDRLMAIRALGEIGRADDAADADKQAILGVLGPQVQSNELFVAYYARRSIAWVKGEDPEPRPRPTAEDIAGDLALLPHTCTVVGQVRIDNGVGPVDLAALIPQFNAEFGPDREEMIQEITQGMLRVAAMIGNARVDAVTVGVAWEADDDGPIVLVVRGAYDRVGVMVAFEQMAEDGGEELSFYSVGETEVVTSDPNSSERFAILMPSDHQFIFMFSESRQGGLLPIDETADLLTHGDAQPAFSDVLTEQIAAIDKGSADAWVALRVSPMFKQGMGEVFGPFDAGRAVAVRDEAGDLAVSWSATGTDADAVGQVVAMMNEELVEGRREIREEMQREKEMKALFQPLVEMMDSIHLEHEGATMTGGLTLPGGLKGVLPMFFSGF